MANLSKMIDHTLLKATATVLDIVKHSQEAVDMGAYAVCVMPSMVKVAANALAKEDVEVCTVVGFPLGATPARVKAFETHMAIEDGATEIDMVINIGAALSGDFDVVRDEIAMVKEAAGDVPVKVIIETSEFSMSEIQFLSSIVAEAGVAFIKTSTGTTKSGAEVEVIKLMKAVGRGRYEIKASGGVNTLEKMEAMIEAGATRIGTSSGSRIMAEKEGQDVSNVALTNY
jgi:deoxyribose-phosphate aldolase